MPEIVTTFLGPYLSMNPPRTILNMPSIIMETEKASDVVALLQPSSEDIGLKKTP